MTKHVERKGDERISRWLASSSNLKKLYIQVQSSSSNWHIATTKFHEVFAGCHLPKLKVLSLRGFGSRDEELPTLLQHWSAPAASILNHKLRDVETWHKTLTQIWKTIRLEPIKKIDWFVERYLDAEFLNDWVRGVWTRFDAELSDLLSDDQVLPYSTLQTRALCSMQRMWLRGRQERPTSGLWIMSFRSCVVTIVRTMSEACSFYTCITEQHAYSQSGGRRVASLRLSFVNALFLDL